MSQKYIQSKNNQRLLNYMFRQFIFNVTPFCGLYSLQPSHDIIAVGTIFTPQVITSDFLFNCVSDRISKGLLCYSTFNFAYWGTISAPNSDLFDQENFFLSFEKMHPEICLVSPSCHFLALMLAWQIIILNKK